nr:MAG TPA: minor structural protein [Caudoviricetes sp.]
MAFTRKFLKALGLNDEQVDSVIEAHAEGIDALKATNADLSKKLEEASKNPKESEYKAKYEKVQSEFDAYKNTITQKEERGAKETAYAKLLKDAKVSEKMIPKIIKVTDFNSLKFKDGKFENVDSLNSDIQKEWGDYVETVKNVGANVSTPPGNSGNAMTKEDILKITDFAKQQEAIKANPQLFTK